MPDTVEYCIGNVDATARERLRGLDCRTVEKPCLQRCDRCFDGPILVVDGEARSAESHADLLPEGEA
jgi:uncharacterized protein YuzB (UPF0349 family)